ncbi:flagellar hook-associated protein FlgK [Sulfurospirillum arcachonense]|uniref:flagellar hook-associated protein FlgK n=1 Tax=Sulfurospirillum arcachonense TaxID=57666 RepID=UPI00046846F2|nr:flagellar hook-associated protein FlgK [Sulfurospirillum arcachonense]
MSLFSTLGTGVSGLKASELAMSTTGHNIANADNAYYTRQRVVTQASEPLHTDPGDIGTGVSVTTIVRIHDEFVYTRLRESSGDLSYDSYNKKTLEEVSKYFPDLNDSGVGVDIQNYFASWNDLASNPDDAAQKIALVQNSETLASNLQNSRNNIRKLQDSVNEELITNVNELNRIGEQIVELNKAISSVEVIEPNRANDLRDQRDQLELTLSKLVDISVFKGNVESDNVIDPNLTDQGRDYNLNISGHSFVDGMTFHPIEINNEKNGSSYYSIYSKSQDGSTVEITNKLAGGKIGAMLDLRGRSIVPGSNNGYPEDGTLQGYIDNLDSFAKTLIEETNNVYAQSAQEDMVSLSNSGLEENISLESYNKSIKDGTFDVIVYDKQGNEVARKAVNINTLTTMDDGTANSIVGQFNTSTDDNGDNNALNDVDDYFTAYYMYDDDTNKGKLSFSSKDSLSGYTIAVDDHGTNFAGAIGLSSFFKGESAADISVTTEYVKDPTKMNAYGAPVDGNNDVANNMIQIQYEKLEFSMGNNSNISETIEGFYRYVTTEIATDGQTAGRLYETSSALFNTVNAEFQSISGVNVDEELSALIKFQASYGANAKVITTVDQMLDTLLGLKQ